MADADAGPAQDAADRWASRLWDLRETTRKRFDTPDQAIDAALASDGLMDMVKGPIPVLWNLRRLV